MSQKRLNRRFLSGVAATALGLSISAAPSTASAAEITIDLNSLSSAVDGFGSSSGGLGDGLYNVARSVTVNGNNVDDSGQSAADSDASTSESDSSIDGLGDLTDLDELTNGLSATVGQTADGRSVHFPAQGTYTSGFGPRGGSVHEGIDIANSIGTPIRAVLDGEVVATGPASGYGNWVVLEHTGGEKSIYGHMANWDVEVGQWVNAGDKIAEIGNEGRSTGPHLHFEILPDGQNAVDPVTWFATQGISLN